MIPHGGLHLREIRLVIEVGPQRSDVASGLARQAGAERLEPCLVAGHQDEVLPRAWSRVPRLYLQNDLADVSTGFEVFVRRSRLREREYLVHPDLHLAGLYPRPNRGLDGLC